MHNIIDWSSRSIHISNHHRMVSLPMDMLMKNQVSQENVLRGLDNENMRSVAFEVASRANSHLQKVKIYFFVSVCLFIEFLFNKNLLIQNAQFKYFK